MNFLTGFHYNYSPKSLEHIGRFRWGNSQPFFPLASFFLSQKCPEICYYILFFLVFACKVAENRVLLGSCSSTDTIWENYIYHSPSVKHTPGPWKGSHKAFWFNKGHVFIFQPIFSLSNAPITEGKVYNNKRGEKETHLNLPWVKLASHIRIWKTKKQCELWVAIYYISA